LTMKRRRLLGALGVAVLMALAVGQPAKAAEKKTYKGFLYTVLDAIGTEDEDPIYFLEQFDGSDLMVLKRASKKKVDTTLQSFIGRKVTIEGVLMGQSIDYYRVYDYEP
jgi:hypothetical protein